jgi:hypothetical protein
VGSAATTDSADTQTASGTPLVVSSAASTDSADTQVASASTESAVVSSAAWLDGADTQTANGTPLIVSSAASLDGADTQTSSGTPLIVSSAASTDSADTQAAYFVFAPVVASSTQRDGADIQPASVTVGYSLASYVAAFAATQAGTPKFYTGAPPPIMQVQTFLASGTFIVPSGVTQIFISATAAGGSPMGTAGQQVLRQSFAVLPGQVITITIGPNVLVASNGNVLMALMDGAPYSKGTRQGSLSQDSGIPGLGFGVDAGIAGPAAALVLWS